MKRSVYNLSGVYTCTLVLMVLCKGVWMEFGFYIHSSVWPPVFSCHDLNLFSAVMILAAFWHWNCFLMWVRSQVNEMNVWFGILFKYLHLEKCVLYTGNLYFAHERRYIYIYTHTHWRRKWQATPVFLPGESQGQGSLVGSRLWCRTESDMTEVT